MVTEEELINSFKDVYDPEVSTNIYDLGLIYNIDISKEGKVDVLMTLTSPFCPAAGEIVNDIMGAAYNAGATGVEVDITFHPEWGPDKISDEGKLELGLL
jgi:metal-sulfur cluster biosynthetic enzyme|tara:strand:- start:810 stop:1109 length:300 start_codon:yes stop_codon:yes gene_type:complete